MSENKVNPETIMHQIRSGVRKQELQANANSIIEEDIANTVNIDSNLYEDLQKLNNKINRLLHRITPNIPVAFMEPRLVSRYKILDRFITPIRRFGNRLFTKWYVDTVSNQQKYLNNDLWFGLNNSIDIITEQNKMISRLAGEISSLKKDNEQIKLEQINMKISQNNFEITQNNLEITQNNLEITQNNLEITQNNLSDEYHNFIIEFDRKYTIKGFRYSDFAKRFSATGEVVKEIFSQYLRYFKPTDTIIDIGCGKGYFLELLAENNLKGIGVDTDPQLITECRKKELEAYVNEGSKYLSEQNDSSIDAVFLAHVIEHLTVPQKIAFLNLSYQKLKNGGTLVIETPNTTSAYVMNNLYYLDPTHERPLLPEALKHLAEMTGFKVVNSYLSGDITLIEDETQYYNFSLILEK